MKMRDYYDDLKYELRSEQPSKEEKEHLGLYKASKRKVELQIKRNEREEETLKKKYYSCLLEFKGIKQRMLDIDHTVQHRVSDGERTASRIKRLIEEIKAMKETPS